MSKPSHDDRRDTLMLAPAHVEQEGSTRDRLVEQLVVGVRQIADELPEEDLRNVLSGSTPSGEVMWSPEAGVSIDQVYKVVQLRCMRALDDVVREMPADVLLWTLAAPSDFGALSRAISDLRVLGPCREADPLAGAVGRSIAHRQRLFEMAGEMLSSAQVEALLGIRRQAIDKRRNAGRLLALRMASDWLFPAFQFRGNETLPGLTDVLQAHAGSDPWVILDTLLAPDEALGGRTLLQAMEESDTRAISRHVAQAQGDGFA